jgi:hypothetical protein
MEDINEKAIDTRKAEDAKWLLNRLTAQDFVQLKSLQVFRLVKVALVNVLTFLREEELEAFQYQAVP